MSLAGSVPPAFRRHVSRPALVLVSVLILTSLAGSMISWTSINPETTTLRSRLPKAALTELTTPGGAGQVLHPTTLELVAPPTLPYFADKRNFFNQTFVKVGWGWTSALWLVQTVAMYALAPRYLRSAVTGRPTTATRASLGSIRRFFLASGVWYYLTQRTWFLFFGTGPSILQRVLLQSGAMCMPPPGAAELVCTGKRGEYWHGGHDVSGHTFMMVLAAMTLIETVAPVLPAVVPSVLSKLLSSKKDRHRHPNNLSATAPSVAMSSAQDGAPSGGEVEEEKEDKRRVSVVLELTTLATLALIGLWWGMLLSTSVYFHSFSEKMSGLAVGLIGWYVSGF